MNEVSLAQLSRGLYVSILIFVSAIMASGCTKDSSPSPTNNPRIDARKLSLPSVGTTVLMPLAKDVPVVQSGSSGPQKNVLLLVLADTKPLAYDSTATLQLFNSASDEQAVYSFTAAELKAMSVTTHCPPAVAKYLDGAKAGEVLFCGGALDLSKIHYLVLKESESDKDFATSYTVDFVDQANDVVAITMAFN